MKRDYVWKKQIKAGAVLLLVSLLWVGMWPSEAAQEGADCSYLQKRESPEEVRARHREELSRATEEVSAQVGPGTALELAAPEELPRKNVIDTILFDRMVRDRVASAPVISDVEYLRRVYLDLTGRIPTATETTTFLASRDSNKRDLLVDQLIGSAEFIDKWTMFFGDLFRNTARSTNVTRYTNGRDAFYTYLRNAVATNKSYALMAREMINANGDSYVTGETNFIVGGTIPMGPPQDSMDGRAVNIGSMFLGIGAIDCLLCHDGEGHLEGVNLWGSRRTRQDAWGMSAFFARTRMARELLSSQPFILKYTISELPIGEYQLNTDFGNRSERKPTNGQQAIAPRYILGGGTVNQGETRREAMGRLLTADRQFARAAVNYLWERMMVEPLVSPSNGFDPDRLDPAVSLPSGWTLQPANSELLEALTSEFIKQNYNVRALLGLIAKSTAYQLSSSYPGSWNLSMTPYYARRYVRRLDAEEIHDSILKATGMTVTYQLRDGLNNATRTVNWAMQLPDTAEPRGIALVQQFLNSFMRGDRDAKPRSMEPTILQALNLMNHQFVMNRIHQVNTGSNVARLLGNTALTPEQIINELYLATLTRYPSREEVDRLTPLFTSQGRRQATESIQWALLNKMDFIFNY